jgi:crossover junction endodeoxyribonuclease RuvC
MRVIGIDPGYGRLGIAILEKGNLSNKETLLYSECIETNKDLEFTDRLQIISKKIGGIVDEFAPESLAIENLFFNTNQKTAMRVAEARGAIINLALSKNLKVYEFTPLQIKVAITGHGRSDKKQVTNMLKNLIEVKKDIKVDDEYDAIAIGLTYFASKKGLDVGK